MEKATLGGGCFWCLEAVYQEVEGVKSIVSGYAGGHVPNPSYEAVCTGTTGHTEVAQITFDPEKVSFEELVEKYFKIHDPTQLNRQGPDVGFQYRSVVFFHDDEQQEAALRSKAEEQAHYSRPVVTQIEPAQTFYEAEDYHQQYLEKRGRSTCTPALQKTATA